MPVPKMMDSNELLEQRRYEVLRSEAIGFVFHERKISEPSVVMVRRLERQWLPIGST